MTDFLVWKVISHYIPQEYFIPISIFLGALLALEQWLASTNRIKANSTFQALKGLIKYLYEKMTKGTNTVKSLICIITLVSLMLAGCATVVNIQTAWNKLTPNDKARIVVGGFQDQLNGLFDVGKSYVASHPEKATEWKTKVIPAFDTANKSLRGYIVAIGMGTATPEAVFKEIPPLIESVGSLLKVMGVNIGGAK